MATAKIILRPEPYDPDAIDADGDGIVQERTPWERPGGTRLLDASGSAIEKGRSLTERPAGLRVVDASGKEVKYTPTYAAGGETTPAGVGPSTPLSDHGVLSLREMGLPTVRAMTAPPPPPATPSAEEVRSGEFRSELQRLLGQIALPSSRKLDKLSKKDRAEYEKTQAALAKILGKVDEPDKRTLISNVALNSLYWASTSLNLDGGILNAINTMWGGSSDAGQNPHEVLENMYQMGGFVAISYPLHALKERYNLSRKQMEFVSAGAKKWLSDKKLKAGEMSNEVKDTLSKGMTQLRSFRAKDASKTVNTVEDVAEILDNVDALPDDFLAPAPDVIPTPDATIPDVPAIKAELEDILNPINPKVNQRFIETIETDAAGNPRSYEAETYIHQFGGDLETIPDHILIETILDEDMETVTGRPVSIERMLYDSAMYANPSYRDLTGTVVENKRFRMELVKNHDSSDYGIWAVWKTTDKETGKEYFLKASQFGVQDSLMERIGDDAAVAAGFARNPDFSTIHIQGGGGFTGDGRDIRWTLSPHVKELTNYEDAIAAGISEREAVPHDFSKEDETRLINEIGDDFHRDAGRMAVLDYLMNNQDRHGGNILVYKNETGEWRLLPIDHGLILGARVRDYTGNPDAGADDIETYLDAYKKDSPLDYTVNSLGVLMNSQFASSTGYGVRIDSDIALEGARDALERMEQVDPDVLFSSERFAKGGTVLTPDEARHIEVAKELFAARIKLLRDDLDSAQEIKGVWNGAV